MNETYQLREGQWVKYRNGNSTYQVASDVNVKTGQEEVKLVGYSGRYIAKAYQLEQVTQPGVRRPEEIKRRETLILKKHGIEKIIYNKPATIVYFNDGTKQVVKISPNDVFNHIDGVLMCIIKKLYGSEEVYRVIKRDLYKKIETAQGK